MINKLKKSKAGFTLVELIVVIAIIGVLAAVLAPQYIKYVESSRESMDKNAVQEIGHAAEVAYVGDGTTVPSTTTFTITITSAGAASYTEPEGASGTTTLASKVDEIAPHGNYTFKSGAYKGKTVSITITAGTGKLTIGNPA